MAGVLDFTSVPRIWDDLARVIVENPKVSLSLRNVERANSAGMVMLVEARGLASRSGCELMLSDIPTEIIDLASMSQCEHLVRGDAD